MNNSILLTNGKVVIAFDNLQSVPDLIQSLITFLSPYFWKCKNGTPHFQIRFADYKQLPKEWLPKCQNPVIIRSSTAKLFNLTGYGFQPEDYLQIAVDPETRTGYHLNYKTHNITFYSSSHSHIHLYEFVRYICLLIEESYGTMLLHASAAIKDGACCLILGDKGSGKTTTLLHLLLDKGYTYFSGDKVLVSQGKNGLLFRGWPDYPHIGIGTLRRFRDFADACGVQFFHEDGSIKESSYKELLDPIKFRNALDFTQRPSSYQCKTLIFPKFSEKLTQLKEVNNSEKTPTTLSKYIEYPHEFGTVHWHDMFAKEREAKRLTYPRLLDQLCQLQWIRVSGVGHIPTESFLS